MTLFPNTVFLWLYLFSLLKNKSGVYFDVKCDVRSPALNSLANDEPVDLTPRFSYFFSPAV